MYTNVPVFRGGESLVIQHESNGVGENGSYICQRHILGDVTQNNPEEKTAITGFKGKLEDS